MSETGAPGIQKGPLTSQGWVLFLCRNICWADLEAGGDQDEGKAAVHRPLDLRDLCVFFLEINLMIKREKSQRSFSGRERRQKLQNVG